MKDNIKYRKGNLLDVTEGIILHGCNAQRVMGSGVALAVKQKYPEAFRAYIEGSQHLGVCTKEWVGDELLIINGITQAFYGRDGKRYVNYSAICDVFKESIVTAHAYDYALHFPKIGAGLGGGDWEIIQELINDCDPENKVKKICWEL